MICEQQSYAKIKQYLHMFLIRLIHNTEPAAFINRQGNSYTIGNL